jgi:hypothetical protein
VKLFLFFLFLAALAMGALTLELKRKNAFIWLPAWISRRLMKKNVKGPVHIVFCFVDHFEPMWGRPSYAVEKERVDRWCTKFPTLAKQHSDINGRPPQHTFFYPIEEYRPEHLSKLADMCKAGFGEVEIHLHHKNDTDANLRLTLSQFVKTLHTDHGLLSVDPRDGKVKFGFIHGNWSLDNSHPQGEWCGVNNELDILRESGCYADFTLPSAPSPCQTTTINSIYYATDDPHKPKSHDVGTMAQAGEPGPPNALLLIQGPLGLNFRWRKWGFIPRIENGDVRASSPPLGSRIDAWVNEAVSVKGRPDWVFVKIHTHGTQETDEDVLLGDLADKMYSYLESHYNDGKRYCLHYVTAREAYNIVKAAEAGKSGSPSDFLDFDLPAPSYNHRLAVD